MGLFLAAQSGDLARGRIEVHSLLDDGLAHLQGQNLPLDLSFQATLQKAERVHVLELSTCAERRAGTVHRDVGVAAQRAFLHIHIGYVELLQQVAQLGEVGPRLFGSEYIGLAHDLHQRRAAAIEIHHGVIGPGNAPVGAARVHQFGGIVLQMRSGDAHAVHAPILQLHVEVPTEAQGEVVLRDLVTLGQIGIEVVLTVEDGVRGDLTVKGQPDLDGVLHRPLVQGGQGSGVPQA
ncbi:MAG: hypothetical protein BWY79_00031 [Actinobacteria bacterium ADurb.Bin444]|nr:MAG: hypothetical protein BWY79_00031 [Actinobacteria bacterium ADurb.Bin444]